MHYDVAIVGGGPGGSTTGSLLKKYRPETSVLILERERFPRDHIGESQLPLIGRILHEMGVWDDVERADFPIKIGGTYRWGRSAELWDLNFIPPQSFEREDRPAAFSGQRQATAFQVDRAIYDDILLRHAEKLGCTVRQETPVRKVLHDGDTVKGLVLDDGSTVTARHYVDASGNAAVIRRALGIPIDCPTKLKNIAIWDYWTNAEWAETIGIGGTRIQVISVGYGWLWFIPLGPTRTSLGLVCPVEYYKSSGRTPEELYESAIAASPRITALVRSGTRTGALRTTNDWSYVSERAAGANWLLVGETAGFADPILSAGLTLTHAGGREAAYTLRALLDGQHDPEWLKSHYSDNQTRRVRQHMQFADFWYSANGQFTDLQEHCREIAREAGLSLEPKQAWQWFAQGGFSNDFPGQAVLGGFGMAGLKVLGELFTEEKPGWHIQEFNVFKLNLDNAVEEQLPYYENGTIRAIQCYRRENRRLPVIGMYGRIVRTLKWYSDAPSVFNDLIMGIRAEVEPSMHDGVFVRTLHSLEALIQEGWVHATYDPAKPKVSIPRLAEDTHHQHVHFGDPALPKE